MKNYGHSWENPSVKMKLTKRVGHGASKELHGVAMESARKQFRQTCLKYGPGSKPDAVRNLKQSLTLFGPTGMFWTQGRMSMQVFDGTAYCAIGAIHQANGKAEHLARLATDLAAGELFPGRAMNACLRDPLFEGESEVDLPNVVDFNDNDVTDFADVKKVFKRAMELLS